ncbi:iron-responsive transcriptional regulator [Aureimonas ureilytica]|uniref:Iron-responsive transcriptional regulator n=1 Tax=Aureimonas ureilytica TaxID=401562 RepID=A0A175RS11_9HYPH|nr:MULTISPECIES: iron-responsive transcriptional regulator RirA [Aureimonas]KTQ85142.1 iron-responsive transcriptional regulator [Aureimonas ureilytica]KTR06138.1 iron-responsive transcriptional regulator [Aureimonas ureilytica]
MRLTRQTNYAIRILMYCAANDDRLSRVGEIAAAYNVSELFLFKILQPLVEAGFVQTVRGRNGGIRLGQPAGAITLRAVVEVTEESFAMAECFETGAVDCPLIDSCALNAALRDALNAFLTTLGGYTIEALVNSSGSIRNRLGLSLPVAAPTPALAPALN